MKFTWDKNKAKKVKVNHKIEFEKIQDIFEDNFSLDYEDEEHSTLDECRLVIVGKTAHYGLVHLVYTIVDDENLRFITARRAEKWLVKRYEENLRRF
jgi:uncharacterized protein